MYGEHNCGHTKEEKYVSTKHNTQLHSNIIKNRSRSVVTKYILYITRNSRTQEKMKGTSKRKESNKNENYI
jgi:hypothetical protein